ncbi:MAG: COX15/CtaA family protein [Pyrinomonadaceae bacterium]
MKTKLSGLAKYAWFVLAFNMLVVLWGVFLRASKSGDGCGMHWLTCGGEVLPTAPQFKTVIEFTHRLMSAADGLIMLIMLVWAFLAWKKVRESNAKATLIMAAVSFFFVLTEGAVGAGLVLTGNTAETLTAARPFWMAAHLINTFTLLTFLVLTARSASGLPKIRFTVETKYLAGLAAGVIAIFIVGVSGSIAALSSMIFPSGTLSESMAKDFSETSHILLRLRLLHPITAILTSVFVIFLTGWLAKERAGNKSASRWSNILSILILAQIAFGSATLLTLAPIVMQLGHLLFADLIWMSFVMFAASFLSSGPVEESDDLESA